MSRGGHAPELRIASPRRCSRNRRRSARARRQIVLTGVAIKRCDYGFVAPAPVARGRLARARRPPIAWGRAQCGRYGCEALMLGAVVGKLAGTLGLVACTPRKR